MQVTELEANGLKRKYQVNVPAATIAEQVVVELKRAGKGLKIPGFRPGFVPMKILQQRYGKAVENDVLNQVIQTSTGEMLRDKKLRPALTPQVAVETYAEGKDLSYTVSLETFPEVPTVDFEAITLARKTFEVEEKYIDEALGRLAERAPTFKEAAKGAKAALGNVVVIDFKGSIDGVVFDGGTAEKFRLELGSKQFIDGFEAQLVGCKVGDEKDVEVTFPENYGSANLAGKPAKFEVKVHEILAKELPAIDEKFAKARGFADVAALRDAVSKQLAKEYDQLVRAQLKKQLFDKLENTEFDLPQGMVDLEYNSIWEQLKQAQAQGDESLASKTDEQLKEEYSSIAKRRVRLGILLAEVSNVNKIQIAREEITRAVMQQASMFPGQERMVMEFYQKNPDRLEDLRGPIMEEKAVDFILTKVKFNDEETTIEALIAASEEEGDAGGLEKPTDSTTSKKKAKK